MSEAKLSRKQEEILTYIKDFTLAKGYPPTVRDIGEAVNLKSTSSVHAHLSTLESKGFIRRDPTKPRAIEIIDEGFQMVRQEMTSIPIVGRVAAGEPILATQNIDGYFPLPVDMVPNAQTFVLKVKGDSMINAGIHSGDSIFVESCNTAKNGDIVVALI
ncbi:MAG: transcriptional repressor LexA, partial [Lachnospiraceae bacterium]|nr:transcriptional repressor LexA [Lachnospiraceae bacterium]